MNSNKILFIDNKCVIAGYNIQIQTLLLLILSIFLIRINWHVSKKN